MDVQAVAKGSVASRTEAVRKSRAVLCFEVWLRLEVVPEGGWTERS
jgi:hypothetical protein